MTCTSHPDLQAFHDGEMESPRRDALQQHVSGCDECSRELRQLRSLSGLLGIPESEEMTDSELARLHLAMDEVIVEDAPRVLRFPWVKGLAAAAASILVIAGAWMTQGPTVTGGGKSNNTTIASQNDWMRIAVTLQVDPPPPGLGEPGLADSQTANWFLENLDGKVEHASN